MQTRIPGRRAVIDGGGGRVCKCSNRVLGLGSGVGDGWHRRSKAGTPSSRRWGMLWGQLGLCRPER